MLLKLATVQWSVSGCWLLSCGSEESRRNWRGQQQEITSGEFMIRLKILCLKVLACVNKVTKMNCSFFLLFELGISFVKKRTGKSLKNKGSQVYLLVATRDDVSGYVWLQELSSDSPCNSLLCSLQYYCRGMPTSTIPLCRSHPTLTCRIPQCPSQPHSKGVGHLPITHRRTVAALH